MAATKYQVLYRYVNEATNTPITNSTDSKYEKVCELYTDPDHKIFSNNQTTQAEATDEQQQLISYGNSGDNPKNNMLFAYDGTKKIRHPKWVPEETGYVVRDWRKVKRSLIGNQGDFTKEFTTLGALTPEDGGIVVCNAEVFKKYFTGDITVTSGGEYTTQEMEDAIRESTIFQLNTNSWLDHMHPSNKATAYGYNTHASFVYYSGPILMNGVQLETFTAYGYYSTASYKAVGNRTENNLYSKATVTASQIETTTIPGHYEESIDPPYLIKDTYKRIQLSPWFVNCTSSSLEGAIGKARVLVDMLGIENVKLIKIVPFDQFVKIK